MVRRIVVGACLVGLGIVVGLVLAPKHGDNGAQENPGSGALVVVSTVDIPANTPMNQAINKGELEVVVVANANAVPGAAHSIEELRGTWTNSAIYENEQIPMGRVYTPTF
jgi:hypothetical protein